MRQEIILPLILITLKISNSFSTEVLHSITEEGDTEEDYDEEELSTQYCGYLLFQTQPESTRLNISENTPIPSESFHKLSKKFENGSVILENPECHIAICGFAWNTWFPAPGPSGLDEYSNGHCTKFPKSESPVPYMPYSINYEITAITCGCKKSYDNHVCSLPNCSVRPLGLDTCAILYQEDNCRDCYYNERFLKEGESFKTNNSAVIRSFIVRPNCTLSMITQGSLREVYQRYQAFNDTQDSIFPSYYSAGEDFICGCSEGSKPTTNPKLDLMTMLVGAVFLFIFFVSTVYLTVIHILRKLVSKRQHQKIFDDFMEFLTKLEPLVFQDGQEKEKSEKVVGIHPYDQAFEIDRKNLSLGNPIGVGTFGAVYEAVLKNRKSSFGKTAQNVAVKTVHPNPLKVNLNDLTSLVNEIRVMQHIGSHPNIVTFIGASTNLKKLEIFSIMELCNPESLRQYLVSEQAKVNRPKIIIGSPNRKVTGYSDTSEVTECSGLNASGNNISLQSPRNNSCQGPVKPTISQELFSKLLKWSKEIAEGMEYLNSKNVLHIDLAARNILLSKDYTAKISDFGLSRKLYDDLISSNQIQEYTKTTGLDRIPAPWLAIESLTCNKYSPKSDIWSYGVTLWEIFNLGKEPYTKFDLTTLLSYLESGNRLECPEFSSETIYAKMKECWYATPEERSSFTEMKLFFEEILLLESNKLPDLVRIEEQEAAVIDSNLESDFLDFEVNQDVLLRPGSQVPIIPLNTQMPGNWGYTEVSSLMINRDEI